MWLWCDALCIDQQRTDAGGQDRARQLPLMPIIYGQAGNVVVHAGGGFHRDEDTLWVLDYLQRINVYYCTEYYDALDYAEPIVAHSHRFHAQRAL